MDAREEPEDKQGVFIADILPGKICSSCGRLSNECAEFKCPKCGDSTITRCRHCREITNIYKCEKCEFEGP